MKSASANRHPSATRPCRPRSRGEANGASGRNRDRPDAGRIQSVCRQRQPAPATITLRVAKAAVAGSGRALRQTRETRSVPRHARPAVVHPGEIETVALLRRGVLESVRDTNIGSIFGLGFAHARGPGAVITSTSMAWRNSLNAPKVLAKQLRCAFQPAVFAGQQGSQRQTVRPDFCRHRQAAPSGAAFIGYNTGVGLVLWLYHVLPPPASGIAATTVCNVFLIC